MKEKILIYFIYQKWKYKSNIFYDIDLLMRRMGFLL
jgi:hypothetical protein